MLHQKAALSKIRQSLLGTEAKTCPEGRQAGVGPGPIPEGKAVFMKMWPSNDQRAWAHSPRVTRQDKSQGSNFRPDATRAAARRRNQTPAPEAEPGN